ncbi:MAG: TPM domain-containing protein [Clostridiales bacterium]|nr:TPM domain-containing protein [Clostridiales bacterium]
MKRIFAFIFCLLIIAGSTAFCGAAVSVSTDKTLSEQEIAHIDAWFDAISKNYGIEAFFVINYSYSAGDEFKNYARGFRDDNAATDDAMVFAVSSDNYYMNACGKAGDILEVDDLGVLYDAIADYDEKGEQYKAAEAFYKKLNSILSQRTGIEQAKEPYLPGSVPIPDEISPVRGDRLVDQADLLSAEAEEALRKKLDTISERLEFDVVIVTAENIGSRTPMEFADDYYDYNGFGYGEDFDGVALLISMAERDWWISTCGYGMTALSDDYFMKIISPSDLTYYLKKGDYEKSFNFFADTVEDFVTEAKENKPYSAKHRFHMRSSMRTGLIWSVIFGLAAAGITTYYKYDNYIGFVSGKYEADDYLVGEVNIQEESDVFLYSNVSREKRRPKDTDTSSSGSSSTRIAGSHTSSSGRTHGGGGGKF